MLIAVAGATGTIGQHIADLLESQGHQVRRLSRNAPEFPADVARGTGLEEALEGVEVVVNATNGPPKAATERVLVDGVRQLVAAARDAHHVLVSIVGMERVPYPYYTLKLRQEAVQRELAAPYSIVRATQFHEFIGRPLMKVASVGVELRSSIRLQPVAAAEAAAAVARVAVNAPTQATTSVAGPQILTLTELRARRGVPVPLWLPPSLGRPLRDGALTDPNPDIRGVQTYHQWLAEQRGQAWIGSQTPGAPLSNRFRR